MRQYKLFVQVNNTMLHRANPDPREPLQPGELSFDAGLHQGLNKIQVHMVAALPAGQTMPNGADAVMEKITILATVATP